MGTVNATNVKTTTLSDTSGNPAVDVAKVAGNAGRYVRQVYVENDATNRSFTTSWSLGATFTNVTGFKAGSLVEVTYYIPLRNDSTSWGGAYVEPQVTFNNSTWLSCGSSGYTAVMENGGASISFYGKTLLLDPSLESISGDFQFNIRFYLKSYDGTLTSVTSNNINNTSGTVSSATSTNYTQHYASIIVRELALLRGDS